MTVTKCVFSLKIIKETNQENEDYPLWVIEVSTESPNKGWIVGNICNSLEEAYAVCSTLLPKK